MPDWLSTLGGALIGLSGTLIVALLGHRQWRRTRRDSLQDDVVKARRQAYEALWRMVERTHIDLRRHPGELENLSARIADINAFVLENEVHLEDGDYALVNRYLEALRQMVMWELASA
jgi:hypothetical protein